MAHRAFGEGGTQQGVWGHEGGAQRAAAHKFLRFSHKKTLILAHFFIEKGHAVSAVSIDNAKIFSQLSFKSKSLGKISERRWQTLLVLRKYKLEVRF